MRKFFTMFIALALIAGVPSAFAQLPCPQCTTPPPNPSATFPLVKDELDVTCVSLPPAIPSLCAPISTDPVVKVIDMRNPPNSPPNVCVGVNWGAPMYYDPSWTQANLGNVFGLCLDDDSPPNIYVTSTTLYGYFGNATFGTLGPSGVLASEVIYKIHKTTGAVTVFADLTPANPISHAGLGNITYDRVTQHFYVTNMCDGQIYRLDLNGTIIDSFDPFSLHLPLGGPPPIFEILGERLWAIDVYQDRVYFSVWLKDRGHQTTSWPASALVSPTCPLCPSAPAANPNNSIWSVQIDPLTGAFYPLTLRLEILVDYLVNPNPPPPNFPMVTCSNPVSDIDFSPNGRMLVSERSMLNDTCGLPCSRVPGNPLIGSYTLSQK